MTSTFCSKPHLYMEFIEKMKTHKNDNITWNEFCKNISYQLNRDFTIVLQKYNDTMFITTDLRLGFNYLESHEIEVREIFTQFNGLCNVILSDLPISLSDNYLLRIIVKVNTKVYFNMKNKVKQKL